MRYEISAKEKLTHLMGSLLKWILIGDILLGCAACATGGFMTNHPMHAFSFDTRHDSPDAEVLDFRYGTGSHEGVHPEKERVNMGQTFSAENTYGAIPLGEFLYVKWRIKNPENPAKYIGYYEDNVDLRKKFPSDMVGFRVHFIINGSQLYVYLISPELRSASEAAGPVRMYSSHKQMQIYPAQAK